MSENKSSSKSSIIIIVILSLILIGLTGYIVYDKALVLNKKESVDIENNSQNNDVGDENKIYSNVQKKINPIINELLVYPEVYINNKFDFSKDFNFYDFAMCFGAEKYAEATDEFKKEMIKKGYVDEKLHGQFSINEYPFISSSNVKEQLNYYFGSDELYTKFLQEDNYQFGGYLNSLDGFIFLPGGLVGNHFKFTLDKYELVGEQFNIYYNGVIDGEEKIQRDMVLTLKKINGEFYLDSAKLI